MTTMMNDHQGREEVGGEGLQGEYGSTDQFTERNQGQWYLFTQAKQKTDTIMVIMGISYCAHVVIALVPQIRL